MYPKAKPALKSTHRRGDGMMFLIVAVDDIVPDCIAGDSYTVTMQSEQESHTGQPGTKLGEAAYCAMYENEGFAPL